MSTPKRHSISVKEYAAVDWLVAMTLLLGFSILPRNGSTEAGASASAAKPVLMPPTRTAAAAAATGNIHVRD